MKKKAKPKKPRFRWLKKGEQPMVGDHMVDKGVKPHVDYYICATGQGPLTQKQADKRIFKRLIKSKHNDTYRSKTKGKGL